MSYIDGFVLAVPTEKKEEYRAFAESWAPKFKALGALKIVECWGDDIPDGETTSFPLAVKCEENETVVFSWSIWPSKDVRDKAWAALEADESMSEEMTSMPFDGKRMIYGGFNPLIEV
ncbi:MAG: DUF1428 domain-containing protein [Pseudomonadota bacterium]